MEASVKDATDITPRTLGAAAILAASDLPRRLVEVPEWGGAVWVQAMSATTRDEYDTALIALSKKYGDDASKIPNARARFLSFCLVDDDGARLFTTEQQIAEFGTKSVKAIDRLIPVARELTPLTDDDHEDLAGN
jgi:hypothetical protein